MKTKNIIFASLFSIAGIFLVARFYKKPVKTMPTGRMEYRSAKEAQKKQYMIQLDSLKKEYNRIMQSNDTNKEMKAKRLDEERIRLEESIQRL